MLTIGVASELARHRQEGRDPVAVADQPRSRAVGSRSRTPPMTASRAGELYRPPGGRREEK
jgi:hypothetical protein